MLSTRIEAILRFLKNAVNEGLRSQNNRTVLLQQAGVLAGDDTLSTLRAAIYTARGRPEAEGPASSPLNNKQ